MPNDNDISLNAELLGMPSGDFFNSKGEEPGSPFSKKRQENTLVCSRTSPSQSTNSGGGWAHEDSFSSNVHNRTSTSSKTPSPPSAESKDASPFQVNTLNQSTTPPGFTPTDDPSATPPGLSPVRHSATPSGPSPEKTPPGPSPVQSKTPAGPSPLLGTPLSAKEHFHISYDYSGSSMSSSGSINNLSRFMDDLDVTDCRKQLTFENLVNEDSFSGGGDRIKGSPRTPSPIVLPDNSSHFSFSSGFELQSSLPGLASSQLEQNLKSKTDDSIAKQTGSPLLEEVAIAPTPTPSPLSSASDSSVNRSPTPSGPSPVSKGNTPDNTNTSLTSSNDNQLGLESSATFSNKLSPVTSAVVSLPNSSSVEEKSPVKQSSEQTSELKQTASESTVTNITISSQSPQLNTQLDEQKTDSVLKTSILVQQPFQDNQDNDKDNKDKDDNKHKNEVGHEDSNQNSPEFTPAIGSTITTNNSLSSTQSDPNMQPKEQLIVPNLGTSVAIQQPVQDNKDKKDSKSNLEKITALEKIVYQDPQCETYFSGGESYFKYESWIRELQTTFETGASKNDFNDFKIAIQKAYSADKIIELETLLRLRRLTVNPQTEASYITLKSLKKVIKDYEDHSGKGFKRIIQGNTKTINDFKALANSVSDPDKPEDQIFIYQSEIEFVLRLRDERSLNCRNAEIISNKEPKKQTKQNNCKNSVELFRRHRPKTENENMMQNQNKESMTHTEEAIASIGEKSIISLK